MYKTDEFLQAHPFGTVPAAFDVDSGIGIFEGDAPDIYQGFQTGNVEVIADGQFYASPTDPVGATGGAFQINDTLNNIQYDGVYAADRTN